MNAVKKLFRFFSRGKARLNYKTSSLLITQVKQTFNNVEKRNVDIVGASYSTSHNNQVLVYRAIGMSMTCFDQVQDTCEDCQIIDHLIQKITLAKAQFIENTHDPDGAGVGTIVDVILELEKLRDGEI